MLCSGAASLPVVAVLVREVDGVSLVGSCVVMPIGVWLWAAVLVGVMGGVPLVDSGVAMPIGVWLWAAVLVGVMGGVPLVGSDVVASMGVGLPVGSAVLGALLAVLNPVERCEVHTYIHIRM